MTAEIVINTGRESFVMLDRVLEVSNSRIVGARTFLDDPVFLGLESLAQLGAYHIRYLTDFSRHVFLIKISQCNLPPRKVMYGEHLLSGTLLHQSNSSFLCRIEAKRDNKTVMEGEFLFAAVDYDHNFRSDNLRHHYAKVFSCLLKDIKTG
ncbi:MAG TPA: hypothetical protein VEF33_12615 [Syntrophales bacterium]|nr:hypothetical protein [Syntrophales bacterium]